MIILSLIFISSVYAQSDYNLSLKNLRVEYKTNPVGIDDKLPRFCWEITSDKKNTNQTAYEIIFANSFEGFGNESNILFRQKVDSDQSAQAEYKGPALRSRQRVYWKVRIRDNYGRLSDWSEPAYWEMGLLEGKDWTAKWIEADINEDINSAQPADYFRKKFKLSKPIKSARLYITSHGLYESFLNGQRVGDRVFTPGWTSYNKRLQYQVYDVTNLLNKGSNAIGVTIGDGWYRGYLGWVDKKNVYGDKLSLLAQLEVFYEDGSKEMIITDKNWKSTNSGPIRSSDIYMGESYDATKEMPGWSKPDFNDQNWDKVKIKNLPKNILVATYGPLVRKVERIHPVKITKGENDTFLFDLGQNMVGWLQLKVTAPNGTVIKVRHAEVLDKYGKFYTENLRGAKQTIEYICSGKGEEIYEPHFTFQGFRFVEMSGFQGTPDLNTITGIVIHSDMALIGNFACSDSMINQLQHNIQWGLKGNFIDVPTDCPQRDERLGWTGDAQVFAPTACFNVDAASFYIKWLKDLALDQGEDGKSMDVIPDVLKGSGGHTGWADASVIVPWVVYLNYGDKRVLKNQYTSMKAWIGYMKERAGEDFIWDGDWHYGDWLSFDDKSAAYMGAYTETDLIATAYFAYSSSIVAKVAYILGNETDAEELNQLVDNIKRAFQQEFLTPNGRLVSHTQTAYTLALAFDLLPEKMRNKAAEYLNKNVIRFKHITTGFLGTPLLCQILTDYGYLDTAYMLLNRKEYPSWLYPVTMGATTIWERWDGLRPDSTFQDAGMNSFNHYAYGAIGKWLYSTVAGINIDPDDPGYKNIIFRPQPGGGLTQAKAEINTLYGPASSGWTLNDWKMEYNIIAPPNTSSLVYLPTENLENVKCNGIPISQDNDIKIQEDRDGKSIIITGSGNYSFQFEFKPKN